MSKYSRTYKDVKSGKSFGTNSFAMLRYAYNNPGCTLESYEPISMETSQQTFIKVTKEQSEKSEGDWTIKATISKNGEEKPIEIEVRKVDWE